MLRITVFIYESVLVVPELTESHYFYLMSLSLYYFVSIVNLSMFSFSGLAFLFSPKVLQNYYIFLS